MGKAQSVLVYFMEGVVKVSSTCICFAIKALSTEERHLVCPLPVLLAVLKYHIRIYIFNKQSASSTAGSLWASTESSPPGLLKFIYTLIKNNFILLGILFLFEFILLVDDAGSTPASLVACGLRQRTWSITHKNTYVGLPRKRLLWSILCRCYSKRSLRGSTCGTCAGSTPALILARHFSKEAKAFDALIYQRKWKISTLLLIFQCLALLNNLKIN